MSIPTITPLPQAPQVTDAPSVFSQRANTFVAALGQLVTETNATTAEINQALAGALVLFDGYKGDWEAGSFGAGDVVIKDDVFYLSLVDSNTQEPPGSDWRKIGIDSAEDVSYDGEASGLAADNVQDALDTIPTVPPKPESGAYTLQKQDKGKHISATGSGNITVPANVFDAGEVVIIYNNTTSVRNIVRGAGVTMFWFDGVDADRSLAQRGLANIFCVGPDTFVISGQGVL